jgi:LmbE family N-acetylglucosaminyl deacetylase
LSTTKIFNLSALVWTPADETVLVLAPHMDDEVIGCGGSLAQHVAKGARVTALFLTDGRHGGAVPSDSAPVGAARPSLTEVRKLEAGQALSELGIRDIIFLDAVDNEVMQTPGLGSRLREQLLRIRPDVVYLPFFLEEHPDHRATSYVLRDAVLGTGLKFRCIGYEVWTPLFPNCFVNIDATVEMKKRALAHYRSQLSETDYLHMALGLNAYRSAALLDQCRFAEAFCALPVGDYLELLEAYGPGQRNQ